MYSFQSKSGFRFWSLVLALTLLTSILATVPSSITALAEQKNPRLVVYTYSTLVSYGLAPALKEEFESRYDVDLQFVATGDSRQMLARLKRELRAGETRADVFVGVERSDAPLALGEDLFSPLTEEDVPALSSIPKRLIFDSKLRLLPYEYGYITLVYNEKKFKVSELPTTFEELTKPRYKNKLILEDPRTSSPGYSFLLWTIHHYGEEYLDYWKRLMPSVLTVAGGWGEAYEMFLNGEAPLVVSFSTDTAYSVIVEGDANQKVLLLNNEGYSNIYAAGIVKASDQKEWGKKFLNLLLSPKIGEKIPTTEWMFPANREARLPIKFYQHAVKPPKAAEVPLSLIKENEERWLREWSRVIRQ
ncbi:thiamine ABC transporter substrate-binding protein [Candidatus Bipolaricaulota bacterium]|nr:thiamine ABC transporter substrate-binding protein [Candidatus Bipolaricaulota bacterium]